VGGQVEAEVHVGIGREALQGARQHAEGARAVACLQVVEGHGHLDEPLEEVAGGAAQARPHLLQRVVALEEEAGVELLHAAREQRALLLVQPGLGRRRH